MSEGVGRGIYKRGGREGEGYETRDTGQGGRKRERKIDGDRMRAGGGG